MKRFMKILAALLVLLPLGAATVPPFFMWPFLLFDLGHWTQSAWIFFWVALIISFPLYIETSKIYTEVNKK